jgi:hypothetical protein
MANKDGFRLERMCGCSRKVAQNGLQTSAGIHMKKCSHTHLFLSELCKHIPYLLYTGTMCKVQDVFAIKDYWWKEKCSYD